MTIPPETPAGGGPGLCSELSARRGLPLIGSAGFYDGILVFEIPAPWTARLVGSRACDAALDAAIARIGAESAGLRLLAVEPHDGGAEPARVRVLHFESGEGAFRRYRRREYDAAREDLASVLEALAFGGAVHAREVAVADELRDVLVCTHGSRDACCGKFGYPVYREFSRLAESSGGSLRAWRCSHLGGHRFAPTALDLPSGRLYGRLAVDDAALVLGGGEALVARVAAIYRGRCALPEAAQIVERDLWLTRGAAFADAALSCEVSGDDAAWTVSLDAGAGSGAVEVRVIRADVDAVATPASCGRDPETEAPWKIVG